MESIGLDKRYVSGEGSFLFDSEGRKYLDFLAGYGAIPFGYHPQQLWDEIFLLHKNREPIFVIPSFLEAAGALSKRLVELFSNQNHPPDSPPLKYVTLANSGSEAVEWAIKIARASTSRKGILSTANAYHGKTLGALSATGRAKYQDVFGAPVEGFQYVSFGNADLVEKIFQEKQDQDSQFAAFIVEPIQGEGGIVVPPEGYLLAVRKLCDQFGVLLILDEIQTGLGRTGKMFAYNHYEGVYPDIVTLAKALGGGMEPIGAAVFSDKCYSEYFFMKHSSTFAGGSMACRVAIKTIDLLTQNDQALVENSHRLGLFLKESLENVRSVNGFSDILIAVRGQGLMLGIEFTSSFSSFLCDPSHPCLLGTFAQQALLAVLVSSWLLNVKGIRLATALNRTNTLRIEPALNVDKDFCQHLVQALEELLSLLHSHSTAALLGFLVGKSSGFTAPDVSKVAPVKSNKEEGKWWKFIVNPSSYKMYSQTDQTFAQFTDDQLLDLSQRLGELMEPFEMTGHLPEGFEWLNERPGNFVIIPRTNEELLAMSEDQLKEEIYVGIMGSQSCEGQGVVGVGGGLGEVIKKRNLESFVQEIIEKENCVCLSPDDPVEDSFSFPSSWFDASFFPSCN